MRRLAAALSVAATMAVTGAFAAGDLDVVLGRALFERDWIPGRASTASADGLGPLFNARSCAGCHAGPALGARFTETSGGKIAGRGILVRFGDAQGRPDSLYGTFLQTMAAPGLKAEGRVVLKALPSGGGMEAALHYDRGLPDGGTRTSFRVAPPLAGRARLERIDVDAVLALTDPADQDGDGISGRARFIRRDGEAVLGRFGWKAANPDIESQAADAFAHDLGLSSDLRPLPHGDCTAREPDCLGVAPGESAAAEAEVSAEMIGFVAAYLRDRPGKQVSAPPAGDDVFSAIGCAACHVPLMPDAEGGSVAVYTDLLLHDMGPDLDDGVGERGARSAEWRTAPLSSLAKGQGRRYLHDGRAATLDVAIRAHGGEADRSRLLYKAMPEAERRALIAFLERL